MARTFEFVLYFVKCDMVAHDTWTDYYYYKHYWPIFKARGVIVTDQQCYVIKLINIKHRINAQSVSRRSLVAAESTLQQPMQPARDRPLFLCGFWMCISIKDWNKIVPQFFGGLTLTFDYLVLFLRYLTWKFGFGSVCQYCRLEYIVPHFLDPPLPQIKLGGPSQ